MNDGGAGRRAPRPALALGIAIGMALLLGACVVGPDFRRPAPPEVDRYLAPEPEPPESADLATQRIALGRQIPAEWWELFHSARLDDTLRQVIAASHSLAAARANLAAAQEEGERYQLAAAYLTLTGSSVDAAIAIASTRLQIATEEDLIRNDEKNLSLVQRELDAGKVARSEVLTAEAQLAGDRTQLPNLHQQLSVARHALVVLAGRAAGEWSPPDFDIDELTLPDDLPVALPSELVRQRPDILAAEAELHADSAAIGVATAQLYPSITLSASLVQESLSLARLFGSAARSWSAGAGLAAPLYRGGALEAQRRAAIDGYDAQLALYQQTVLQAFGQVADVLAALEHDAELAAASRRSLDIASAALSLQRSSYAAGKTNALQLISAENAYSAARLGYARARAQRLEDTAQLLLATGGGWWNRSDLVPAPQQSAPATR